ncbi:MAG: hypothetical protein IPF79_04530 [Ignavibacteria bacterium]|nr:hypothetical protein [Ignavibacteria bacterium]
MLLALRQDSSVGTSLTCVVVRSAPVTSQFDGAHGELPIPKDVANGQYIISLNNGAAVVMSKMFVVSR